MKNNKITEYRKASAKALGFKNINIYANDNVEVWDNHIRLIWQPDKDANQMLMVLDWLREQKVGSLKLLKIFDKYCNGADMKVETTEAFMEFIT